MTGAGTARPPTVAAADAAARQPGDALPPRTREWLEQPALARLWAHVRRHLERNGRRAVGRVRLPDASDAEREAVSLLLGRACRSQVISLDLAVLDAALRQGAASAGLLEVAEALHGPVPDRRGSRHETAAAWDAVWRDAADALAASGVADGGRLDPWLAELRSTGALTRLGPQRVAELLAQAVAVLAAATSSPDTPRTTPRGRGELAARHTGTAHGLDDDTVLARVVLRALARLAGREPPADARGRRELWEWAAVWPDSVSTTVLTHALRPTGGGWLAEELRRRADHGAEAHLTMRDIRRIAWATPAGTVVFVCENPRIVEAAADARCPYPVVCTSGNPAHPVLALLDALTASGARLAYHGDFDWPGIAIANRIMTRYAAQPWRMEAADYEHQVAEARGRGTPLQPLAGEPVPATWDAELTAAMQSLAVAVHEESALELLLSDLRP